MYLSKAFNTAYHQLLLAKLHAYGFSKQALAIICSYLSNRKQRIKINIKCASSISPWTFVFQHYMNDLFFFLKDVGTCKFC